MKITVIGSGGHGSNPGLSNNPIIPAVNIYQKFLKLVETFKEKGHNFNTTLPMFHAGTAMNVVPE